MNTKTAVRRNTGKRNRCVVFSGPWWWLPVIFLLSLSPGRSRARWVHAESLKMWPYVYLLAAMKHTEVEVLREPKINSATNGVLSALPLISAEVPDDLVHQSNPLLFILLITTCHVQHLFLMKDVLCTLPLSITRSIKSTHVRLFDNQNSMVTFFFFLPFVWLELWGKTFLLSSTSFEAVCPHTSWKFAAISRILQKIKWIYLNLIVWNEMHVTLSELLGHLSIKEFWGV